MLRFYGSIKRIKVKGNFTKKLDELLDREMRNAAREFIKAAMPRVPVWTGQARGSFIPLCRFLRLPTPVSRGNLTAQVRPQSSLFSSEEKSQIRDRIAIGARRGQRPETAFGGREKGFKRFTFHISIPYYAWQDVNGTPYPNADGSWPRLRNPLPWGSIAAGEDAFQTYLLFTTKSKARPKLEDFLDYEDVRTIDRLPF